MASRPPKFTALEQRLVDLLPPPQSGGSVSVSSLMDAYYPNGRPKNARMILRLRLMTIQEKAAAARLPWRLRREKVPGQVAFHVWLEAVEE